MAVSTVSGFLKSTAGRWALLGLGALGVLLIAFAIHGSKAPAPALSAKSEYVDSAECATCHHEIAATYRKTGMARSFYRPTSRNVVEDYTRANTVDNKASGLRYTMTERDGKFFQRRSEIGYGGHEANVREEQADYIIGSGNHARTYLHRSAEGKLIEMPVNWYTERSGSWAMSPGFDRRDQEDFRRAITPECMFCHNGYPEIDAAAAASRDATVFGQKLPEGIDCQRCHGPGRAHVEAAGSGHASVEAIRQAIVNPARLDRDRQLEVCMQCHLETSSRHLPNEIRAYEREIYSYRPGQPLGDYKLYFQQIPDGKSGKDDGTEQPFEIVHAVTTLRRSACFRNSQMTCSTCHNPHDIPRGEAATVRYTQICQGCHQKVAHTVALPVGETCLSCHMPKRRTEDAVHVVMTDHFIQRVRPTRDLLAPIPEVIEPETRGRKLAIYYPEHPPATPATELYVAMARAEETSASPVELHRLESLIERDSPGSAEPYLELGRASSRLGENALAIRSFEAALQRRPAMRPATQGLVAVLLATGENGRAIDVLQTALGKDPGDSLLLTNLGNAYLRQGKVTEAKEALGRAVTADPELPEASNLLGLAALASGDVPEAERLFREAIRLQTDNVEARNNLGNLLASKHEFPEATYHFQRAIAIDPIYAAAHHGFGLLLMLTGTYPQSASELREAVRLDPKNAQTHDDLGDVLAALGQIPAAAEEYRQVLRLKPDQSDAELGLGMALLQERRPAEARSYLEAAAGSSDGAISQAARDGLQHLQ